MKEGGEYLAKCEFFYKNGNEKSDSGEWEECEAEEQVHAPQCVITHQSRSELVSSSFYLLRSMRKEVKNEKIKDQCCKVKCVNRQGDFGLENPIRMYYVRYDARNVIHNHEHA